MEREFIIAVLALGNIGRRHLSAILNCNLKLKIYCYDVNKSVFQDDIFKLEYGDKKVVLIDDINDLPEKLDFALLAMTADKRREVFDKLTSGRQVSNILFEKVLFQKEEDYIHVLEIVKKNKINAWVNCARRQMADYQKLRQELSEVKEMAIHVAGGEWGLGCNAVHMIDMIEFLSGSIETEISELKLLPTVVEAKRQGFKEIYGCILGSSGRCSNFSIMCMKDTKVPTVVSIFTDIGQYTIYEESNRIVSCTTKNNYERIEDDFEISYVSKMSGHVVEDILMKGKSNLTVFEDAVRLHLLFIKPLTIFFKEHGVEDGICPIT